jgi:hypothetical protein
MVIKALGYYSKENILTPERYQLNLHGSKHDHNSSSSGTIHFYYCQSSIRQDL